MRGYGGERRRGGRSVSTVSIIIADMMTRPMILLINSVLVFAICLTFFLLNFQHSDNLRVR